MSSTALRRYCRIGGSPRLDARTDSPYTGPGHGHAGDRRRTTDDARRTTDSSKLAERLAERAARVSARVAYSVVPLEGPDFNTGDNHPFNHLIADLSKLVFDAWGQ